MERDLNSESIPAGYLGSVLETSPLGQDEEPDDDDDEPWVDARSVDISALLSSGLAHNEVISAQAVASNSAPTRHCYLIPAPHHKDRSLEQINEDRVGTERRDNPGRHSLMHPLQEFMWNLARREDYQPDTHLRLVENALAFPESTVCCECDLEGGMALIVSASCCLCAETASVQRFCRGGSFDTDWGLGFQA